MNDDIENWPGYDQMVRQLDKLEELQYEDVCELEKKLIELQKAMINENVLLVLVDPLSEDLDRVAVRKSIIEIQRSKEAEVFHLGLLHIDKDEVVNGFKLYECDYNLVSYSEFLMLKNLWIENIDITDDNMRELINELEWLKISWSIINKHGDIMYQDKKLIDSLKGGDIKEVEKSYLYDNIEAVINLPYPREVILNSILIGGDSRYDSPRYCNFFCEWLKRKMMNEFMFKEVVEYIQKIKILGNGRIINKYLIAEIVELKYGHMYTFYQIMKIL